MRNKSAYHKTDEMDSFDGKYFYSKNADFKISDFIYVISATSSGLAGNPKKPYLEGKFQVIDITEGTFSLGHQPFDYKFTLETILRPKNPISLMNIQKKMGNIAFKNRFLNQPKPILKQDEIQIFNSLLEGKGETNDSCSADSFSEDINNILEGDTERAALIMARIGQGKFRRNVKKIWKYDTEICAATLLDMPSMLIASHIIPWRECIGDKAKLRWDGANGILLCTHLDRLFDKYLITFKCSGSSCSIRYSKIISSNAKSILNLTNDLEIAPNRMKEEDRKRFFSHMDQHYLRFTELEESR